MHKKVNFTVDKDEPEVKNLIKNYFLEQGFMLTFENSNRLVFSRGNYFLNMITFNPLKWKSEIEINIRNDSKIAIQSDFKINSTGQAVTHKEEDLWNKFVKNFENSVKTGKDFTELNKALLRETKNNAWGYIKWALIGAIVTGIPMGVMGNWLGNDTMGGIGAAGGAMAFMMNKINGDIKANK